MNKGFFILILMLMIASPLFPASPTMVIGLDAHSLLFPGEEGFLLAEWFLNAHILFSYRSNISNRGYYSLFTRISGGFTYLEPYIYSDEEIISLETGFHFKNSKLVCTADFDSSITGTYDTLPFYSPEWELVYFFVTERKKIHPFLSYQGYYSIEPESSEDIFYEGAECGIEHRPTVTNGYSISLGFGWEQWPEYPVYSPSGTLLNEIRNDFLCMVNGKVEGIFRFFLDWEIALSVVMRWSNANSYYEEVDYFNEKSEDRIGITLGTKLEWSPSRYIHIKLHPYFAPEFYFYKHALTTDGSFKGENVRVYAGGGTFHFDWTPDNSLYISFESGGMIYFSNHLDELYWNTLFTLGCEYSLKFLKFFFFYETLSFQLSIS